MEVTPIPCLSDNYAYLIVCEHTQQAAVIDPSEAKPVLAALEGRDVTLTAILNTHHHWDHVGGNKGLLQEFPNLAVYGHHSDRGRIHGQTVFLNEGDEISLGNLTGTLTHNPGHTTGAVTYYFEDAAFTGDTMFAAGCGRLFEGTAAHMHESLNLKIGDRDPATKIYFGHEYTESNLVFAAAMEPNNTAISTRLEQVRKARAAGEFTTPSTLAQEWETNPFMRVDSPEIHAAVRSREPGNDLSPAEVLRVVRTTKDSF